MKVLNVQLRPELALMSLAIKKMTWTKHASERAAEKGIALAVRGMFGPGSVVEVEVDNNNKLCKVVLRVRNEERNDRDNVLVLRPCNNNSWLVITCWTNHINDNHSTLKMDRLAS